MEEILKILQVSELNDYIKGLVERDPVLQDLWVEGEVSNLSQSVAGHLYFTLKDSGGQIRCVLFRSSLLRQSFLPKDGDSVIVHGRVGIYGAQGLYQLYVDLVQPQGVGFLHLQFEALKARLEEEGLFDQARKRLIPPFPQRIALVTSPVGAALQDILNIIKRRYPLVEVIVAPALVQGSEASESIASAMRTVSMVEGVDLLILARGGGSLEELWPFNEEVVARSIFASRIPVITGVGHETDVTIADLVADLRAPTPSAAAELAVPDRSECLARLDSWQAEMESRVEKTTASCRHRLAIQGEGLDRLSPARTIERWRGQIRNMIDSCSRLIHWRIQIEKSVFEGVISRLDALSPKAVLERGFSICRLLPGGEIVRSTRQVLSRDKIEVQVSDGVFRGTVW